MNSNWRTPVWHCCLFVVVPLFTALPGCGAGGGISGTIPAGGKVTYNGQPVGGAIVTFLGAGSDARPATATTESDGTFKLKTLDADGAMPGAYSVVIKKTEIPPELTKDTSMEDAAKMTGKTPPLPKELLPVKYGDPGQTPLKFEVKAGQTNTFELALTD